MLKKLTNYFLRLPKIIYWNLIYLNRLKVSPFQSVHWDTDLKIKGKSEVIINHSLETRRGVAIRVESGKLEIGSGCFINTNSSITSIEKISIGKNCKIGNNVVIVDHDHDYKNLPNAPLVSTPVSIGENVWIGANSVILRGTEIGDNCVIAAGTIVKGQIPDDTIVYQKKSNIFKKVKGY
ncbi:acyltransferase [Planococcus sp. ANT_H30]|uniref:acyltransferase n=1 Tax=Planococcus sp. ANT_H30 TaxID=2597347 RepID=UPI0011EC1C27|nr:acyltransferase [Planococcus sp. ANT_H30]KAA0958752.1 acyltransferase [Planococcus sp. ANT_H30]